MRLLSYHPHGTNEAKAYDGDEFEQHNGARQIGTTGSKVSVMNTLLRNQGLGPICEDRYMSETYPSYP